jgi:hypothetical protein
MSYHDGGVGQLTSEALLPVATFRQTYDAPTLMPVLSTPPASTQSPALVSGGSHWMAYAAGGVALVGLGVGAFFVVRKMRRKAGSVVTNRRR